MGSIVFLLWRKKVKSKKAKGKSKNRLFFAFFPFPFAFYYRREIYASRKVGAIFLSVPAGFQ
jgi:hypothetical protein